MLPKTRPARKKSDILSLKTLLLLACAPMGACAAIPPPSTHMPAIGVADAPSGLVRLCRTQPEVCRPQEIDRNSVFANFETEASSTGAILSEGAESSDDETPSSLLRGRSVSVESTEQSSAEIDSRDALIPASRMTITRPSVATIELASLGQTASLNVVLEPRIDATLAQNDTQALSISTIAEMTSEGAPHEKENLPSGQFSAILSQGIRELTELTSDREVDQEGTPPPNARTTASRTLPLRRIEPSHVVFNDELFELVDRINMRINASIIPRTDEQVYGRNEYWTLPLTFRSGRAGDCEDYALEKREALLQAGIPASALFFAVGHSPATGRHAVLMISTDQGDYVLDNMTSQIRPWFETGYTWISRQSASDPLIWSNVA